MAEANYTLELSSVNIYLNVPYSLLGTGHHARIEEIEEPELVSIEIFEDGIPFLELQSAELTPGAAKSVQKMIDRHFDPSKFAKHAMEDYQSHLDDAAYEHARDREMDAGLINGNLSAYGKAQKILNDAVVSALHRS